MLWACGFAAVVLIRIRGFLRIRAAVRASSPMSVVTWIPVRSSPGLLEPGVTGLFRPTLLLPAGITDHLTPRQLEAVLAHELSHVRRRDNLTAAVHMLVEAIFWFHPLVWWIGARMVEERERACDEAVLHLGSEPRDYAEAILNVCKLYAESPLACVPGVTGADLSKRIEAIMANRSGIRLNPAKKATLAGAATAVVILPVIVGMLHAPVMSAQSVASAPRFEVASVRPCRDYEPGHGRGTRQGTKKGLPGGEPIVSPGSLNTGCAILAYNYPMAGLIQRVYGRLGLGHVVPLGSTLPISGGPAWIYNDSYIVNAKAPNAASEATMEGPMLQALLEDRFKLQVHRETRQVPVYGLTVAKGGPKFQRAVEGDCVPLPVPPTFPPPQLPPGKKPCSALIGTKGPNFRLLADETTLDYVSKLLGLVLDRPVIDRTGLTGKYKIYVEFARDQSTTGLDDFPAPSSDEPSAPSIFTAVEQQLGLKLEATKGPREFLVIDHIERPWTGPPHFGSAGQKPGGGPEGPAPPLPNPARLASRVWRNRQRQASAE